MSLKRRFQYRYANLMAVFRSISFPRWVFSNTARGILIFTVVILGVLHIVKTTSSASVGYEMNRLEKQIDQLENEIQKINIEVADYSSMANIKNRLSKLDMVVVEKIKYFEPKQDEMAKK